MGLASLPYRQGLKTTLLWEMALWKRFLASGDTTWQGEEKRVCTQRNDLRFAYSLGLCPSALLPWPFI